MQQGVAGGEEAARRLNDEVQMRFENIDPEGTKDCKIIARVYLDLDGLFQTLRWAGLVQDPETIRHFSRGFSQYQALFDMVDIGHDSEHIRLKIEGDLASDPDPFSAYLLTSFVNGRYS